MRLPSETSYHQNGQHAENGMSLLSLGGSKETGCFLIKIRTRSDSLLNTILQNLMCPVVLSVFWQRALVSDFHCLGGIFLVLLMESESWFLYREKSVLIDTTGENLGFIEKCRKIY